VAERHGRRRRDPREAAFEALVGWFSPYAMPSPDISPSLCRRIRDAALHLVRDLPEDERRYLEGASPRRVLRFAEAWAGSTLHELLPFPSPLWRNQPTLLARRESTRRALVQCAVEHLHAVHGCAHPDVPILFPRIADIPPGFGVRTFSDPGGLAADLGGSMPAWLPRRCPRDARPVLSIGDGPLPLARPLSHLRLSMDSRHRWWVLWVDWVRSDGTLVTAPGGLAPRSGVPAFEAAYHTTAAFFWRFVEEGLLPEPPWVPYPGLLGEALVEDLILRLWPAARAGRERREAATPGASRSPR
jgi:hypothetical protein